MSRRMLSTTVYLTPEQDAGLKARKQVTGRPLALLIRDAIDALLRQPAFDAVTGKQVLGEKAAKVRK